MEGADDETMTDADGEKGKGTVFGTLGMTMELSALPPEVFYKILRYAGKRRHARGIAKSCCSAYEAYERYPKYTTAVGIDRLAIERRRILLEKKAWDTRLVDFGAERISVAMSATDAENFLNPHVFCHLSLERRDIITSVLIRKVLRDVSRGWKHFKHTWSYLVRNVWMRMKAFDKDNWYTIAKVRVGNTMATTERYISITHKNTVHMPYTIEDRQFDLQMQYSNPSEHEDFADALRQDEMTMEVVMEHVYCGIKNFWVESIMQYKMTGKKTWIMKVETLLHSIRKYTELDLTYDSGVL